MPGFHLLFSIYFELFLSSKQVLVSEITIISCTLVHDVA